MMKIGLVLVLGMWGIAGANAITPAEEPVVQAVEKTLPAVVNINTKSVVQKAFRDPSDPFNMFFNRYYLRQQEVPSLGSGVLIAPEGYIVTNAHVVDRGDKAQINITLANGSVYTAKFLRSDPDADLALLKIEDKKPFPFIDLKVLSPNLLGQTVIALGNPIGYQNSVSQGILSAKNRTLKSPDGGTLEGLLQTDAAINPGNSGGALVDINGNFVGLNSAKIGATAVEGIGFAIAGDKVAVWAEDAIAIAKGLKKAPTPVSLTDVLQKKFGFTLQEMTPDLAAAFGYQNAGGMVITEVEGGSPAEKAGLKRGIVLVRIGNFQIVSEGSLPRDIQRIKTGDNVIFTVSVVQQQGGLILQRSVQVPLVAR